MLHHRVEVETTGEHMLHEHRDIGSEPVRAHERLLDALAHEQIGAGER